MNLERRADPFRRPAHGVAERWTNAGSASRIDGSDWPARAGSVLPSLDTKGARKRGYGCIRVFLCRLIAEFLL